MPRRGAYSITPVAGYNVCWQAPAIGDVQVPAGLWLDTCSTANAVPGSGDGGRARSVPREASSEVGIALSRLLERRERTIHRRPSDTSARSEPALS
jgi:hypothetical protein